MLGNVPIQLRITVYVLAMVGHLKNVCPIFAQMPDRITNVEFTTVSPHYCQYDVVSIPFYLKCKEPS